MTLSCLECEAYNTLYSLACEYSHVSCLLLCLSVVRATILASMFALAVFANNDLVQISSLAFTQWGLCTAEDLRRLNVGILLESLADSQPQPL